MSYNPPHNPGTRETPLSSVSLRSYTPPPLFLARTPPVYTGPPFYSDVSRYARRRKMEVKPRLEGEKKRATKKWQ